MRQLVSFQFSFIFSYKLGTTLWRFLWQRLLCGYLLKVKRQNALSRTKSLRKMQYPAGRKAISGCKWSRNISQTVWWEEVLFSAVLVRGCEGDHSFSFWGFWFYQTVGDLLQLTVGLGLYESYCLGQMTELLGTSEESFWISASSIRTEFMLLLKSLC